ncbi:MAG: hypothetical protein RIS34_1854 [Pseudomonadota bacterium]|jgi:hypothetical protein
MKNIWHPRLHLFRNSSHLMRCLAGLFCGVLLMTACAQDATNAPVMALPGSGSTHQVGTAPTQAIRVIVQFKQVVPYSSSAFLMDMKVQTQANVSYIAAVSGDTHVYGIQPLPGQTITQVLQRLGNMPVVRRVEVDQQMKFQ